jgi:hypothetical protein
MYWQINQLAQNRAQRSNVNHALIPCFRYVKGQQRRFEPRVQLRRAQTKVHHILKQGQAEFTFAFPQLSLEHYEQSVQLLLDFRVKVNQLFVLPEERETSLDFLEVDLRFRTEGVNTTIEAFQHC